MNVAPAKEKKLRGRNPESNQRKTHIEKLISERLGELHRPYQTRDQFCSADGMVHVFITDSKGTYQTGPWFDMKKAHIEDLSCRPHAFVIFIQGGNDVFLVIPIEELQAKLQFHREGFAGDGYYHLEIPRGRSEFHQIPGWDLRQYRNKIELIPLLPR
jgi:hypothetical protein